MVLAPGAFLTLGFLYAVFAYINIRKKNKNKKQTAPQSQETGGAALAAQVEEAVQISWRGHKKDEVCRACNFCQQYQRNLRYVEGSGSEA